MSSTLTRAETMLLAACTLLLAVALFAPALAQPADAHAFVDHRNLWGMPHGLNVLSNLAFALAGAWGLAVLAKVPRSGLPAVQRGCAGLFFAGLVLTAAGSAWYHFAPADGGLAVDRAAMSVAFAGLLGLAAASHAGERAGRMLALAMLASGPLAVGAWLATGNVLPWAVVQFGGMLLLLLALAAGGGQPAGLQVRWTLVLLAYAAAKLFEANDQAMHAASGELLSGHTLKHVAAAFAALPVIAALAPRAGQQNGRQTAVSTA